MIKIGETVGVTIHANAVIIHSQNEGEQGFYMPFDDAHKLACVILDLKDMKQRSYADGYQSRCEEEREEA